jgi:serine kinase of HPr protein (carbohydrate metabolism regulator)
VKSFGVSFELSANHPDLSREVLHHLPLGCKPSASSRFELAYSLSAKHQTPPGTQPLYQLRRNGQLIFSAGDRQEFLNRFHATVSLDVAERSIRRTFIHAGVVGWANFAILIPGRSFTGKSTLVAELIRAGASYYSDEFALIDKIGRVHPYARPLQIRENGDNRQIARPVEEFGATAGRKPLPVKLVLVTRFKPGAQWRPRRLSPGIGLLTLLDNTVSARRSPSIALRNLKEVVSKAQTFRSARGEASQIVDWLTTQFGPPRRGRSVSS